MRKVSTLLTLAALATLAGCSGGNAVAPSTSSAPSASFHSSQIQSLGDILPDNYTSRLYVADNNNSRVERLNAPPAYTWNSNITNQVPCPSGDWVSRNGISRLYVTNFGCRGPAEVSEFTPAGALSFDYSSTLADPINVTSDSLSRVYVADLLGGKVVEFKHHVAVPIASCATAAAPFGVAVDAAGDVFVSEGQLPLRIYEYPGPAGLGSCSGAIQLPATFPSVSSGGALLLDASNNLVACDQSGGVWTISPPTNPTPVQIPGTSAYQCLNMSLNGPANVLFVTEPFKTSPDIQVIHYPSGAPITTIVPTAANQIGQPTGVAAYPG